MVFYLQVSLENEIISLFKEHFLSFRSQFFMNGILGTEGITKSRIKATEMVELSEQNSPPLPSLSVFCETKMGGGECHTPSSYNTSLHSGLQTARKIL